MVTDGILIAVQGIIDNLKTPEEQSVGELVWKMLSEFDEDKWFQMNDEQKQKWIDSYTK